MDKHSIIGKGKQIRGSITEGVGKLINSDKLQRDGKADQFVGHAQEAAGHIKEAIDDAKDKAEAKAVSLAEHTKASLKEAEGLVHIEEGKASHDLGLEIKGNLEQIEGQISHTIADLKSPK